MTLHSSLFFLTSSTVYFLNNISQIEPAHWSPAGDVLCAGSSTGTCDRSGMCSEMMKRLKIKPGYDTYKIGEKGGDPETSNLYLDLTRKWSTLFVNGEREEDENKGEAGEAAAREEEDEVNVIQMEVEAQ